MANNFNSSEILTRLLKLNHMTIPLVEHHADISTLAATH